MVPFQFNIETDFYLLHKSTVTLTLTVIQLKSHSSRRELFEGLKVLNWEITYNSQT